MASTPAFASVPLTSSVLVNAADVSRTNPSTNSFELCTGGSSGSRIDWIIIQSVGTLSSASTANVMRLWFFDGATKYLYKEIAITTATPSATAIGYRLEVDVRDKLFLEGSTQKLYVSLHTCADPKDYYHVTAIGGDF